MASPDNKCIILPALCASSMPDSLRMFGSLWDLPLCRRHFSIPSDEAMRSYEYNIEIPFRSSQTPTARRMRLGLRASSSRHAKLKPFTVTVCVCMCAWGSETECVCHERWGICVYARAQMHLSPLHNDPLTSAHPLWITGYSEWRFTVPS